MALANKLAVVTGANCGIGKVIATELARHQAHVVMACRSRVKSEQICEEIRASTGNSDVEFRELDLTSLNSVKTFVNGLEGCPVHVLVNNAGVMSGKRELTVDGLETSWQVNAVGPTLLSRLLLSNLFKASQELEGSSGVSRIVYVGSMLDKKGNLEDLKAVQDPLKRFASETEFSAFESYGTSKLGGTLLHKELDRRVQAHKDLAGQVLINSVSPGVVNTSLNRNLLPWPLPAMLSPLLGLFMRTPEQGAETPLMLAVSQDSKYLCSGRYFRDGEEIDRSDTIPINDEEIACQLWNTADAMSASVCSGGVHLML